MELTGQVDLFDLIEDEKRAKTPPCLYNSPARGRAARATEFEAWEAEYGQSSGRSHAWWFAIALPTAPTKRCQATALTVDVRRPERGTVASDRTYPACDCFDLDELMYRGACLRVGCNWEGDPHPRENPAVEDAMDHAWPGWREVPIVPKPPFGGNHKTDQRWLAKVIPLYPPLWIESGGPVRTLRQGAIAGRHHGPATPCGGFDMGVIAPEQEDK